MTKIPEEKPTPHAPCPFCKGVDIHFHSIWKCITCYRCSAEGPWSKSEDDAWKSWDRALNSAPEADVVYTQGVCEDGAAILKDGVMMTIEEILDALSKMQPGQTNLDADTKNKLKWIAERSHCPVSMQYAEDILEVLNDKSE